MEERGRGSGAGEGGEAEPGSMTDTFWAEQGRAAGGVKAAGGDLRKEWSVLLRGSRDPGQGGIKKQGLLLGRHLHSPGGKEAWGF